MNLRTAILVVLGGLLILCGSAFSQNGLFTLDHVNGSAGGDSVYTDTPIEFFIRMTNNTPDNIMGQTNGFRVFSYDSVQWGSTVGTNLETLAPYYDGGVFITHFSNNGMFADTVGLGGFSLFSGGVPIGFDENILKISIGPIADYWAGSTICLDSAFFPPAGFWKWAATSTDYYPDWGGPYCFAIIPNWEEQDAQITLDSVTGLSSPHEILSGTPVTFHLRATNNWSESVLGYTNGLVVYSPDGAEWGSTTGSYAPAMEGGIFDLVQVINEFSTDGVGRDTLGFGGASVEGSGMPVGFDHEAFRVTIGPIDSAYVGRTICLDSTFFPPTGYWMWAGIGGTVVPAWDGPHCFTVVGGPPPPASASIVLDHVDGSPNPGSVATGQDVRFNLRMTNHTGMPMLGFTNGFAVYSPDGAEWNPAVGDTASFIDWSTVMDGGVFINHFSATGNGTDTVGFGGFSMFGDGIPTGTSEVAFTIDVGPIDLGWVGRTLCLDSVFYPPTGYWLWSMELSQSLVPDWGGPYCFLIEYGQQPYALDSLIIPSVETEPCQAVQPVQVKLTQPIKGASIPIAIPMAVVVDSLSFEGLETDDWEFAIKQVNPDSGFVLVALANSHGEVIPEGTHTVFNIFYSFLAPGCPNSTTLQWNLALQGDPSRSLLFADANNNDLYAAFDYNRDATIILGYLPGDFGGDFEVNVADLTALVDFLYLGGPAPCVLNAADANGSCTGPNIADVTYVVDYLFQGGTSPQCGCLFGDSIPPKISTELTVFAYYNNGATTIYSSSEVSLSGIELELSGGGGALISLLDERFEMLSSDRDGVRRIALVDMEGEGLLESGEVPLVRLEGRVEVKSAIASDLYHNDMRAQIDQSGKPTSLPDSFELLQNVPNPFNPVTAISFALPESRHVRLDIYNVVGQRVVTLSDQVYEAGNHTIEWNGNDARGTKVASGVYLYRLTAGDFVETKKMMLLK